MTNRALRLETFYTGARLMNWLGNVQIHILELLTMFSALKQSRQFVYLALDAFSSYFSSISTVFQGFRKQWNLSNSVEKEHSLAF